MRYIKAERDEYTKKKDGSYYRSKGEIFYQVKRIKTKKGKYRIQTHQVLNHETIRKRGFKPQLKLVDSRYGGTFKKIKEEIKGGKILSEHRREKVGVNVRGNKTYEYISKKAPRSTPRKIDMSGKPRKERYKIQFVGYFQVITGKRKIIVLGYTDGYEPGIRRPPREELIAEAAHRASGKAGFILQTSNFIIDLIDGGYRYHSYN